MLTPNGLFATSVWDEASRLPFISIARTIAQEMFQLPPPRPEPPTEIPDDTLESVMIRAGFTDVRAEKLTVTLQLASAEAFTQYLVDVSPVVAAFTLRSATHAAEGISVPAGPGVPALRGGRWELSRSQCNHLCGWTEMSTCVRAACRW